MTITLELPEDLAERLQADARAQGTPLETLATAHIAAAYAAPPVPHVADEDAAGYAALIAEGDADFAAGRAKSFDSFRTGAKQRLGTPL